MCKERGQIKKKEKKNLLIVRNIKNQLKLPQHIIRKEVLKNLTFTENVDGIKKKQRQTNLTNFTKWILYKEMG